MTITKARGILANEAVDKSDDQIKEILRIAEIFAELIFEKIDSFREGQCYNIDE